MTTSLGRAALRFGFALLVFAALMTALLAQPAKRMSDFDQVFYLTIAFDLDHHGVFSNGIFDAVDSTRATPPPGMFFTPLYPFVIFGAMKLDPRFARAVDCTIEANEKHRDLATCEIYARPINLLHALFLAIGVLAVARAGELIFPDGLVFYIAGVLAAVGLAAEAELFSYIMTESIAFATFSLAGLALVHALATWRVMNFAWAGLAFGIACLTRPSYLALVPVTLVLISVAVQFSPRGQPRPWVRGMNAFAIAVSVVLAPWLARNAISVGKLSFTEEYGAAVLIERFAFNEMTAREFALAFPYCVPTIGPALVARFAGAQAAARFEWNQPRSFFEQGRARRIALIEAHARLDPIIGNVVRAELGKGWRRHLATMIPLAWCGLWVGGVWSLALLPVFVVALVTAWRASKPLFLIYAAPALLLVGAHGLLANHYPRYNLGLIGPVAVGTAWIIARALRACRAAREAHSGT